MELLIFTNNISVIIIHQTIFKYHTGLIGVIPIKRISLNSKLILYDSENNNFKIVNQTNSNEGCTCQECGNKYMVDIIVPDDIWEEIKPYGKPKGSGLLCGQCIFRKIENLKQFSSFQLVTNRSNIPCDV
jgi:hypothetical protein